MTTYKDKKVNFDKKLNLTSYFLLAFIVLAYSLGATITWYPSSTISFLPPQTTSLIGLVLTTVLSMTFLKGMIDYFISQEIDEELQKINNNKNEDLKLVELSPYKKNIFDSIGLEYISILYKVFGRSWVRTEPYRIFSKSWSEQFIELTEDDIENFETQSLASVEAVQILLKANEKLDSLDGYSILQTISKQSVINECNRKISLKTEEEQENLYRLVLVTLSAWLICSIKYQVKIPPVEIHGKYIGDLKNYLVALEFVRDKGLTDMYRNLPDDGSLTVTPSSKELISECIDYLIKDLGIYLQSNKSSRSRKIV